MNIKELIKAEVDARRQNMVYELYGLEEDSPKYHRVKGMHDAYVDMLTYLDYSIPEEKPSEDLEEAAESHIRKVTDAAGHPGWNWETRDVADAFKAGAGWGAEHLHDTTKMIPEDLVEAAMEYEKNNRRAVYGNVDVLDAFMAGAEWQKAQMPKWKKGPADAPVRIYAPISQAPNEMFRKTQDYFLVKGKGSWGALSIRAGKSDYYLSVDELAKLPKEDEQ